MTSADIESIAVAKVKEELRNYIGMFTSYFNENDKTPFWDGEIWIYKEKTKTKKEYGDRIFVQIKGVTVPKLKTGNSKFPIDVETLRGFQKDKKGTLLFVTEIVNSNETQLYYANLLPVDLKEILDKVKPDQKTVTVPIRPVIDKTSSSIKFICLNFLKNSDEQLKVTIKNIDDLKNIKEIKVPIQCDENLFDEYLLHNDIYSYAITQENEKIALPKLKEIVRFKESKQKIKINEKIYYEKITSVKSKDDEYILLGKSTKLYLNKNKIDFKIHGNLYERINDMEFILELVENKYFDTNIGIINFPLNENEKSIKFIESIKKDLKSLKEIKKLFDKFKVQFDIDLDSLTEEDYKNINLLVNAFNGVFPKNISQTKLYNVKIAKYKIVFITLKNENGTMKAYNYFENLDKKIMVFYFNEKNEQIPLSIYIGMTKKDFIEFSNINFDTIKDSFKNVDYSETSLIKTNEFLLEVLKAYDLKNDKELLNLANFIIDKILQYSKEDVYLINQMQIIKRQRELTKDEKMILYNIKKENTDKQIQLAVSILLDNKSDYEIYSEELTQEEKDLFSNFHIANLINFG